MQNYGYLLKRSKYKFTVVSFKRLILSVILCTFTLCLVLFSNSNLNAAREGLALWANNVVPSLLPFFIATELLNYTDIVAKLGKFLNPIMRPFFHIPGIGSYAFLMGIISGYPTGAKIVVNLKESGFCSIEEAERMIAFTNNSGPLFILGTIGVSLFGNSTIGFLLLLTHVLGCLSVGIIFRFYKYKTLSSSSLLSKNTEKKYVKNEQIDFSNLGEILGKSIMSGITTVVMIGGFVVLFSVILSILKSSNIIDLLSKFLFNILSFFGIDDFRFSSGFVSGILELTNGVMQIANIPCKQISINIILVAFLLGFGGFSVLLQVYSIISKSGISIKAYCLGKLLHAVFACFYTYIFITYLPIFNLNL